MMFQAYYVFPTWSLTKLANIGLRINSALIDNTAKYNQIMFATDLFWYGVEHIA